MTNAERLKIQIQSEHQIASNIIEAWHTQEHPVWDAGSEPIKLDTMKTLLSFIHKEELLCRELAQNLPKEESIRICITIHADFTYGIHRKYHKVSQLNICAAEAIRILLYDKTPKHLRPSFSSDRLFELLKHVEIMLKAKELAQRIDAGILFDTQKLYFSHGDFQLSRRDFALLQHFNLNYTGKGLRLRFADETMKLLSRDFQGRSSLDSNFSAAIQTLLSGSSCGEDIPFFKGTFYEFFPAVNDCDHTYKEFLENLLCRIRFLNQLIITLLCQYIHLFPSLKYDADSMSLLLNSACTVSEQTTDKSLLFTPEWKRWKPLDRNRVNALDYPVIPIGSGNCATSFALCGDALNSWIEDSIYGNAESVKWKEKLCQKMEALFETDVTDYMRRKKFKAGQIEQNGIWHADSRGGTVDLGIRLSGEVDVFAVNDRTKTIYLIECKCIHDVFTASGNIYQKFKNVKNNLSQKYVQKLKKKRETIESYVNSHLPDYKLITVILTDIDFPVYLLNENIPMWENIISICDFEELKRAVEQKTCPKSCVQHI